MKSIFLTLYLVVTITIASNSIQALQLTGDYLSWAGVFLTTGPVVLFIAWIMLFSNIARTRPRMPVILGLGALGLVMSIGGFLNGGAIQAPVMAAIGFAGYLVYAFWYSSYGGRASDQLKTGVTLTEFELRNVDGKTVSSSSLVDKPAVWIFYRGNWCPLCMAQIKEVAAQYRALEDMGVRVVLISPQPHRYTGSLARKFDVSFDFMTDDDNQAAGKLGIAHRFGLPLGMQLLGYKSDTVMPTVIITDKGGKILWTDETDNYRVRPEPEQFLQVLAEQGIGAR